jgi:hypothetical protein
MCTICWFFFDITMIYKARAIYKRIQAFSTLAFLLFLVGRLELVFSSEKLD